MLEFSEEDVGNIVLLEHVNLQVPDQARATVFYVLGLGLTRDPYLNVGLHNMWVNAGEQQFHLPTRPPQVIDGHIALVLTDLNALAQRLASVERDLSGTAFRWSMSADEVRAICPWGNEFRCYGPDARFGDIALGIPYVEFLVPPGAAKPIARFYAEALGAPAGVEPAGNGSIARIGVGRNQALQFRETEEPLRPYGGHHIAIYVANFSRPYGWLKRQGLIAEEVRNHQFRFKCLFDPDQGQAIFSLEHEVRSLHHAMFRRSFINRDPAQSQRAYNRERDALVPFLRNR
jgi:catechol 2,3-dioxygenase-like lactoylglutathione lyase family enzyme